MNNALTPSVRSHSHSDSHVPMLEVAAAVLLSRDHQYYLLARRSTNRPYAGYWEFPGGKIEAGEDVRTALFRELDEELGIRVTEASPWLTRSFLYPHAFVRIHFWRVTVWDGKIGEPLAEHSEISWNPVNKRCKLSPLLPANIPVLQALAMPSRILITQAWEHGVEKELERIRLAISRGIHMILVRERELSLARRLSFIRAIVGLSQQSHDLRILLSESGDGSGCEMSRLTGAYGIHLTSSAMSVHINRPDFPCVGASCHNKEDLQKAESIGLDYATLGPVFPTLTHPDAPGMGWQNFAKLALDTAIPIYAIGGQGRDTLVDAQSYGAHGIACMRNP